MTEQTSRELKADGYDIGVMMSRFVVLTLIASLGSSSVAFAGETLANVAVRVTREVARNEPPQKAKSAVATPVQKNWAAQEQPALSSSGMSKRTKMLIFLSTAVGVVAVAYAIDHRVEDNTPSSLGIRQD